MLAGRNIGIEPVGLGARDTLRLEAAMPLYGHELSESLDPYTAGLGFAVNLRDRNSVSSEALAKCKAKPSDRVRIGLRVEGRRPAREGAKIVDRDNRAVGSITSGTFSPSLQYPIAMGYINRELAIEGNSVEIDIRGSKANAEIVKMPFFKKEKK